MGDPMKLYIVAMQHVALNDGERVKKYHTSRVVPVPQGTFSIPIPIPR
jgi:hypothetical protein